MPKQRIAEKDIGKHAKTIGVDLIIVDDDEFLKRPDRPKRKIRKRKRKGGSNG